MKLEKEGYLRQNLVVIMRNNCGVKAVNCVSAAHGLTVTFQFGQVCVLFISQGKGGLLNLLNRVLMSNNFLRPSNIQADSLTVK